jgi:hypothetical protein
MVAVLLVSVAGCGARAKPPFQSDKGLRFTPPPGWGQRDREGALPPSVAQHHTSIPLPALNTPGKSAERLIVRYDRVSAGQRAWLRVSIADLPASTSLDDYVAARAPAAGWKRQTLETGGEIGGLPAARAVFTGRFLDQDYISESVAVRRDAQVYVFSASFPASDPTAREEIRKAIEGATWN